MNETIKTTLNRIFAVPEEPVELDRYCQTVGKVASVILNIVFVLAVMGLVALNERGVGNYLLSCVLLTNWFLIGLLRK